MTIDNKVERKQLVMAKGVESKYCLDFEFGHTLTLDFTTILRGSQSFVLSLKIAKSIKNKLIEHIHASIYSN